MTAVPLTANPERLRTVIVNGAALEVERVWKHGERLVFKFHGIDSIGEAEKFSNADICIPREDRPELPAGEYYQSDLIGCTVVERGGGVLGTVAGLQEFGGAPLLELDAQGKELLIPFAKSICVEIDPVGKRIVVELPEGLKELNQG